MHATSIASSSSGNSTLISNDTVSVIVDSGVAVKQILEKTGRAKFDAIFLSHEHGDHIKTAGALARKTNSPIYVSALAADKWSAKHIGDFDGCTMVDITDTSVITLGNMTIRTFSTKHDAAHSLGFIFEEPGTKFCYLTDTGRVSKTMLAAMQGCDSYFIECDYDENIMQGYEEYSQDLKDRITSDYGHLSTGQVLDLVQLLDLDRTRKFILGHLSPRTNNPERVLERIKERYPNYVNKFIIAPFDGAVQL